MNSIIDIHADDFGLSENSDKNILNLCLTGKLNSLSIIPNLQVFPNSVKNFNNVKNSFPHEIKISVHLNFMEGKPLSNSQDVQDLIDKNGYFSVSWGKLFLINYIPFLRKKIKKQLTTEIISQIDYCIDKNIIDSSAIRIDSHQHPHLIPLFYESIFNAIKIKNYKIEYIRNTNDPINYYKKSKCQKTETVNIIKCIILNHYSKNLSKLLKKNNYPDSYLCGVYYSGKMDNRITNVIPVFEKNAKNNNRTVELLFHPGLMKNDEITKEFTKQGFNEFHLSENRTIEYNQINSI